MKKLILIILISLSSSIQAESYFCSYSSSGETRNAIIERSYQDVFWWTAHNNIDKYLMKLVYETDVGIFLMGNFSRVNAGATVLFINKKTREFSVNYQMSAKNESSDVFYGNCLVQ
jgi:hypothetical protein